MALNISKGLRLEEHEAEVWRRAESNDPAWFGPPKSPNRRSTLSVREDWALRNGVVPQELGDDYFIALKIFPEAYDALGRLIVNDERLVTSGLLSVNYLRRNTNKEEGVVREVKASDELIAAMSADATIGIALELQEAISERIEPSVLASGSVNTRGGV